MAGEGDVVIGGEEGDQAKGQAADGLGEAEAIKGGPRRGRCWQFWRNRRLLATGWRPGGAGGRGHGAGAVERGEASFHPCHRCHRPPCSLVAVVIPSWGQSLNPIPSPLPCPAKLLQLKPCLPMGAATSRSLENQSDGHRSLSSLKALIRSHAAGYVDRYFSVAMQVETRAAHQGRGQNYDSSGSG